MGLLLYSRGRYVKRRSPTRVHIKDGALALLAHLSAGFNATRRGRTSRVEPIPERRLVVRTVDLKREPEVGLLRGLTRGI